MARSRSPLPRVLGRHPLGQRHDHGREHAEVGLRYAQQQILLRLGQPDIWDALHIGATLHPILPFIAQNLTNCQGITPDAGA